MLNLLFAHAGETHHSTAESIWHSAGLAIAIVFSLLLTGGMWFLIERLAAKPQHTAPNKTNLSENMTTTSNKKDNHHE